MPDQLARRAISCRAVPTRAVMCTSWPQACITGCSAPAASAWRAREGLGDARALLERQPVHVGAQHHVGPAPLRRIATTPVPPTPVVTSIAERAQLLRHARAGLHLAARQFGIAVEMIEQGGEIGAIVLRHRLAQRPLLRRAAGAAKRGQRRRSIMFMHASPCISRRS